AHPALFGFGGDELDRARVTREYRTAQTGVTHLTWRQEIDGVEIFECRLNANVMADGRLINIGGTMLPRPAGGFKVQPPTLGPEDAILRAAANVAIRLKGAPVRNAQKTGPDGRVFWEVEGTRKDAAVVTRPIYFPVTRDQIRAAWAVVMPSPGGAGHTYDMIVDAADGSVLYRANRLKYATTEPITFRMYTSDSPAPGSPGTPTPNGFQFPEVARSLVTFTPQMMQTYSPNGWINDGGTDTQGNNCDVHTDLDSNNIADLPRPNGGAARVFDFPMNTADAPSAYRDAATTQLFYLTNFYHDRLYALGFDEAAGNFQTLNFSGQGVGNDRIQVDGQDGGGTSNANWNSSGIDGEPDSTPPRTQMYVFTGPNPDRDGGLEADIVYHEFSHGLSIRLHDGRLDGDQQEGGMGEGWSDFFGLCLNAEPGDDFNAVYAFSPYITYFFNGSLRHNYYFGIRRFPYSTDTSKNPLTFADIDPGQMSFPSSVPRNDNGGLASEVHNVGEAWCMALLECREQLSRTMGFAANDEMMRLAVSGMKLNTASALSFINSRDAVLQADLVANAGANRFPLWDGFAKRGLGVGATSPGSSASGVVESFTSPGTVQFTFPQGVPALLTPGAPATFTVDLAPVGLSLTPASGLLRWRTDSGTYQSTPLTIVDADTYSVTLPALQCGQRLDYYLSVHTSNNLRTFPTGAPAAVSISVASAQSQNVFVADDVESDRGWTVGPNTATSGLWVRVNPNGTSAQPEDDASPFGTTCWVTGQGIAGGAAGNADVDNGATVLTSPAYDLSGTADAIVSYYRSYDNTQGGSPGTDPFYVQISTDNGATWRNAEVVGPSGPGTTIGWVRAEWTLSSVGATPTSQVRFRFIADDASPASLVEAAVDEFRVAVYACGPAPCAADWNTDGGVDADDVIAFFAEWDAGDADFNGDSGTDADDVIAFFGRWDSGC
ncbi:MAG: M36 family metallopeptidase, partial [Phycisphaerales bacterium]